MFSQNSKEEQLTTETRKKARIYFQSLSGLSSYKAGEGIHVMVEHRVPIPPNRRILHLVPRYEGRHFILKKGRVFTRPEGALRYARAYARHHKSIDIRIDIRGLKPR